MNLKSLVSTEPSDKIFSFHVVNLSFNFLQVVQQHTLGVVDCSIWILFTIYSSL